jgi:ABC-2 type transport system ATP-binding protein
MATSGDSSIRVEGLTREFKGGVKAVDGVDFSVGPGEIYGFLGPNGAGKSTTVHMLTTLLPPTGGRALVGGFDVAKEGAAVRGCIGAALQEVALDPVLSGREHMKLQGSLQGLPKAERDKRTEELLERVGLTAAAERKAGEYSGGMKRRLDLAMALIHKPAILFLDEPTTGLDPQSRAALWDEVARLAKQEGVTVFLTTQYLEEADVLADRISIIDGGHLVAEGTPASLKAEIGMPSVEVVPSRPEQADAVRQTLAQFGHEEPGGGDAVRFRLNEGQGSLVSIVRALDGAGLDIAQVQMHAPTLDDVFLTKTGRHLEGAGSKEEGAEEAVEVPV